MIDEDRILHVREGFEVASNEDVVAVVSAAATAILGDAPAKRLTAPSRT